MNEFNELNDTQNIDYTPIYIFYTEPSFHMVPRDIPMKLNDALNEPK